MLVCLHIGEHQALSSKHGDVRTDLQVVVVSSIRIPFEEPLITLSPVIFVQALIMIPCATRPKRHQEMSIQAVVRGFRATAMTSGCKCCIAKHLPLSLIPTLKNSGKRW